MSDRNQYVYTVTVSLNEESFTLPVVFDTKKSAKKVVGKMFKDIRFYKTTKGFTNFNGSTTWGRISRTKVLSNSN